MFSGKLGGSLRTTTFNFASAWMAAFVFAGFAADAILKVDMGGVGGDGDCLNAPK